MTTNLSAVGAESDELAPVDAATQLSLAREIALRQLTVRSRSRAELQKALAKRKVSDDVSEELLSRFEEVGLIDDQAFAKAWVDSGQRRLRGPRAIAQELQRKGVAAETVAEAIAGLTDEQEYQGAKELAEKKLRSLHGAARDVAYRRLTGALARRGFSTSVISRVVRETLGQWHSDD